MATEFCDKCKQSHPGRVCDYDDKGECSETIEILKDEALSNPDRREKSDRNNTSQSTR